MEHAVDDREVAVVAGAGPAGLTAALELLRRSSIKPIVFEADSQVGGISKTINYRGNRMDLGGHRFFSKSDWVMRWWQEILPVAAGQSEPGEALQLRYQQQSSELTPAGFAQPSSDSVMLVRQRLSRIFYRRRFFNYPLKLNSETIRNMGLLEMVRIGISYGQAQLRHRAPESSLEDFFINRFGQRLYRTFFKAYTEKVWGVPCREISADWGAQRIKGLSITRALTHAATAVFRSKADTAQRNTETSLIERFLYPKLGPGQMWEEVSRQVITGGGELHLGHRIVGLERDGLRITAANVQNQATGSVRQVPCKFLISTMPVCELVEQLNPGNSFAESEARRVSRGLPYRDFMTVGLLLRKMKGSSASNASHGNGMPPDNWIYIQEPDVKIGRLQVFNNWSPAMVADPETIWLGLEYFCREGDELWSMKDRAFIDFAAGELEKIGMINITDVIDGTVVRVPKAYPAYFGDYAEFDKVRTYLESFSNLYPIGRNGMHRYNNQDHSMLAANGAVTAIVNGGRGKSEIWGINADDAYHEEIQEVA
jgi:protoporphyrinogen oxidase